MDEVTHYYASQAGTGSGGAEDYIGPVYKGGFTRGQSGRGVIGDLFRGVWSWVSPLFKSGASALGREALNTGGNLLGDLAAAGPSATADSIRDMAKARVTQGRDKLVEKMRGAGRRKRRVKKTPKKRRHVTKRIGMFGAGRRKKRQTKRKKLVARTKQDIFGNVGRFGV